MASGRQGPPSTATPASAALARGRAAEELGKGGVVTAAAAARAKALHPSRSLPDVCPNDSSVPRVQDGLQEARNGPSVVTDQHKWTVYHSKVNLPAALNDPRRAKRESDFFTKTWGLEFTEVPVQPSPHLPEVTREDFEKYLSSTSKCYAVHQKYQATCPQKDEVDRVLDAVSCTHGKQQSDLEQVPKMFLKPDFALEDPATFNTVLPWSQFGGAQKRVGARNATAAPDGFSSRLLQEKLSHYLDVVEVNLARQISLRSDAFFQAMESQRDVQEHLRRAALTVRSLRSLVGRVDTVLASGSLRVLRLATARRNAASLHGKLKLMAAVQQTQPTVQLLLSTAEYSGALDLIATTQEVLQQELQGVHSFRHLGSQLCELEKLIDKMMVEEICRYAEVDLNRTLQEGEAVLEEERLVSLVFGLLRQRRLDFLDMYNDRIVMAVRNIVKQTVMEAISQVDEIDTEIVTKLADQIRLMIFPLWLELLQKVFSNLLVFLRRVKATLGVMRDVVHMALERAYERARELEERTRPPPRGPSQRSHNAAERSDLPVLECRPGGELPNVGQQEDAAGGGDTPSSGSASDTEQTTDSSASCDKALASSKAHEGLQLQLLGEELRLSVLELERVSSSVQELLHSTSDCCHDRCVKFIMARARQDGSLERLSPAEFVALSQAVEGFVAVSEEISGRKSTSLRGALQSQASRFVQRFHEERRTKLSLLLDNERWKQADVPAEFQQLVDSMAGGVIALSERKPAASQNKKLADYLFVDGQKYTVVSTVLLLIRMVLEYCQCVEDIPSVTTDMLPRLTDLLKHFNSRSCQLVLGAGALQVVGLKTITTKNLALASRCLQLILQYIPLIRAHFEARLQPKQYNMLRHFDHMTKDYSDHIGEISAKLVAIMDSMCEKLLFRYEVKAPVPSACFRNVSKQMAKMHEAVCELLPNEQVQLLFLRINACFKQHLKGQLSRLGVVNDGGPQHGLVTSDLAFYVGNLRGLNGLEQLDLNLTEIWEQKR
ncbi:vacuolar protein sorting-associated protein 54 isoform X1 [Lampetra planeri]